MNKNGYHIIPKYHSHRHFFLRQSFLHFHPLSLAWVSLMYRCRISALSPSVYMLWLIAIRSRISIALCDIRSLRSDSSILRMLKCCLHWWMNWRDIAIIICARMHRLGVLVCPVTKHILPQLSCLYSISIVLHILFQWLPLLDSFGKVKLCLAEGGFRKSLQRQWSLESLWSFHCFCSNHFIVIKTPSSYVSRRSCTSISRNFRNRWNTSSSCKAVEFFLHLFLFVRAIFCTPLKI